PLGRQRPAVIFEIEFTNPNGRLRLAGLFERAGKIFVHVRKTHGGKRWKVLQAFEGMDHLLRRTAASVAIADWLQRLRSDLLVGVIAPDAQQRARIDLAVVGVLWRVHLLHENAGAVDAFPPETRMWKPIRFRPADLDREQSIETRPAQYLRQSRRKTEGV